ncbi:MAG: thioredoxin-dependent thiol peroxidase [Candidatus Kapaibacterium sp.]|jgi:peroxiredoxin Q/BCP
MAFKPLEVGSKAPEFKARDDQGNSVTLKGFRGKKVVLYFYPKDDTSGCTKEACDFRDNYRSFQLKGAVILGVSPDTEKSHQKFKLKNELPFQLLVDEERVLANLYGVWKEKAMYGKTYMGIERTTFVIDEKGIIAYIFPKVKTAGHAQAVLEALRS